MTKIVFQCCFLLVLFSSLNAQFVTIKDGSFYLGESKFTPLVMNYTISIRHEQDSIYWVSPAMSYYTTPVGINCKDKNECFDQMVSDFQRIKDYGFNTLRIVDFEFGLKNAGKDNRRPFTLDISYYYGPLKYHEFIAPFEDHFQVLDQIVLAAKTTGLKIILVSGGKEVHDFPFEEDYNIYLQHLARRYRNESSIMAYDLLNEPTYFHKVKDKKDAHYLVHKWTTSIRQNTFNQLITIGLTGSNTAADWDPLLLDLDFVSYHLYPDKNGGLEDYYKNIYWASKNNSKPWIIGETGFAASGILSGKRTDGNLTQQNEFLIKTFQSCLDCGGSGYSWWQFHDVAWSEDYGMLDSFNQIKPFANMCKDLLNYIPDPSKCRQPFEYYSPFLQLKKSYSGQIVNEKNEPIANAIIRASTTSGSSSSTYSRVDGSFTIYNQSKITAVSVSAIGYESVRKIVLLSFPTIRLKKVEIKKDQLFGRIKKNDRRYCLVISERDHNSCLDVCENNKDCRRECKANFKKQKKACKKEKLVARI